MIIELIAKIRGNCKIITPIDFNIYKYRLKIYELNTQLYISISRQCSETEIPHILDNGSIELPFLSQNTIIDILNLIYYIEAIGSFQYGIYNIETDNLEVKLHPQSTQEQIITAPISSIRKTLNQQHRQHLISENGLKNLIFLRRSHPEYEAYFTYYRRAKDFFDKCDYYFSSITSFMMLEHLYSENKTRQKEEKANFKQSPLLKLTILFILDSINKSEFADKMEWLRNKCKIHNKVCDFDGIVDVLVKTRGEIAHGSTSASRYLANSDELRPLAFFMITITDYICGCLIVYSSSSEKSIKQRLDERIKELETKLNIII